MKMTFAAKISIFLMGLVVTTPASAFCEYEGKLYYKTTIPEEYKDSKWVVRVTVVAQKDNITDNSDGPWTLYSLKVTEVFKGKPARNLKYFTECNSGAFYLESRKRSAVGEDYLLFLNPSPRYAGQPKAEVGFVAINYSCGQSKRWAEVSQAEKRQLRLLGKR